MKRFFWFLCLWAFCTGAQARFIGGTNLSGQARYAGYYSATRTSTGLLTVTYAGIGQSCYASGGAWYSAPSWRAKLGGVVGYGDPATHTAVVTIQTNLASSYTFTPYIEVESGASYWAFTAANVTFGAGETGTTGPLITEHGDFPGPRWFDDISGYIGDPVSPYTGKLVIAEKDLSIPGPFPFGVTRHYESGNVKESDFGLGWTSSLTDYLWPHLSDSLLGGGTPINMIRAVDSDGSVIDFAESEPGSNRWQLNIAVDSGDNPMAKTMPRFPSVGRDSFIFKDASGHYLWAFANGTTYDYVEKAYPRQGLQRLRPYLERVTDPQGNVLTYIRGEDNTRADYGLLIRIESSAGRHLDIERRDDGLIGRIVSDDGREYLYSYEEGSLKTVTTPDGVTTYDLKNPTSDIVTFKVIGRITRPGGRILENDYDDQCRVTAQRATVDPTRPGVPVLNATFDYSTLRYTKVTDAYGRLTSYDHTSGLLQYVYEPGARTTTNWWYENSNPSYGAYARGLQRTIDPRGLITDYKYDENGNVIETKLTGDLDGDPATPDTETHVVTAHYDSINRLEWSADSATGLTTAYLYEATDYPRLATRVLTKATATGAILRTDQFDYTERSTSATPPATGTITARGLLAKRTLALGSPDEAVTDYDYDATGFRSSEIRRSGTADPDVALAFTPTARREIGTLTDAAGRATVFTYDGASRVRTHTVKDEAGTVLAVTDTTYTGAGEVARIDGPRSGPEDWVEHDYDQAGRPTETRVWRARAKADGSGVEAPPAADLKAVTTCHHDLFGNLVLVIDPRGHATTHQYDELGRLTHTRRFDAAHAPALLAQYQADMTARHAYDGSLPSGVTALSEESFTYEPGGQVATHTDVLGGITTTLYNSRGQPRHQTRPDGSVAQWRYRADGRLVKEILRDGSYWQTDYDDIARTVVRSLKKPDGTVLATETRVFDRRGNPVSFTDTAGAVTTTAYDDLDRVKTVTGPAATPSAAQQIALHTYDAAGIVHTVTNALGESTATTRDALGRATRVEVRDAGGDSVRVGTWAWSADHQSVTLTEGTGTSAVAITTYADPAGRPLLTRFGDGTFTRQTYDLGGLPAESYDALGRVTTTTHDALGLLSTRTLPAEGPAGSGNGQLTTFVHNPAGQLLERRMASPQGLLVAKTVFDAAGRPTRSSLVNGIAETRVYTHAYYPATHAAWAGLPATTTDPRGIVRSFAYDDFLRLQQIVTDGPAPETDSTTTYTYDTPGRLTSLTQTSPASAAGPATLVTRLPDAQGHTDSENVSLGGIFHSGFTQRWDEAGRRTRLTPSVASGLADPGPYAFAYRADGSLAGTALAGFSAAFDYDDAGLLRTRDNAWRRQSIDLRDSLGRIVQGTTSLATDGSLLQTETRHWRADGTLDDYAVTRSGPGAWDETRDYAYDARARVTSEDFSPAPGETAALVSTFDHGSAGLGIRTETKVAAGAPAAWQARVPTPASASISSLGRVLGDETNAAGKTIDAHGLALGADFVTLRVNGSSRGRTSHPGWADATGAWSQALTLDAGAQILAVDAMHPSGHFAATTSSAFTVSVPLVAITNIYDAEGNLTARSFTDGRMQYLTWDGWNRLIKVTERNTTNTGYDWSAVYDGLGRRLRTTHQTIVAGAAAGAPTIIASLYDPEVEFLEVGVVVNGTVAWKVHGPDLDGRYGGWNGTGGLEAVLTADPESMEDVFKVKAVVTDAFGNTIATVTGLGPLQKAEWSATRVGGYGPLPNHRAELLTAADRLAESLAWRGRRIDPTGFYWLGARYYEPSSGRFLSPDPLGHGSDMSLYAFANGDPVNRFDPDGRFGKDLWGNPYGLDEGYPPPTGLDKWLLDHGLARDNRGDIADAYGRWQGAVDADALGARMLTFAQFLAIKAEGDFALERQLRFITTMATVGSPAGGGGVFTGSMSITGKTALYEVGVVVGDSGTILSGLRTITQQARAGSAETLVISTGHVINENLAAKLLTRAQTGETMFGGAVKVIYQGAASPKFIITIPIAP